MNTLAPVIEQPNALDSSVSDTPKEIKGEEEQLGKEDFLRLLAVQLQYQDPLAPMDNKDMILQLSQFSTLEATQNMNKNFEDFIKMTSMSTAAGMIGKQAKYIDVDSGAMGEGIVEAVDMSEGEVQLLVNGRKLSINEIIRLSEPAQTDTEEAE